MNQNSLLVNSLQCPGRRVSRWRSSEWAGLDARYGDRHLLQYFGSSSGPLFLSSACNEIQEFLKRESNKFFWLYCKQNNLKSHKFRVISSPRFQRYFTSRYAYTEQTILTVANLSIHSSGAPNDARPISCLTNQDKIKEARVKDEIYHDVTCHRKTMFAPSNTRITFKLANWDMSYHNQLYMCHDSEVFVCN